MINNFKINQNNNFANYNNNDDFIYLLVFKAITNLTNSGKTNDLKIKIIRTIIKIFQNIITSELTNKDSENYRKIRVTNPDISLIFDIKGNYEFFKSLGFNEQYFGEDLCLYLPRKNINIPLFYKLISFIELISLNFQDNSQNYYELKNQNNNNFNNNFNNNISHFNNNNQINIIHIKIIRNNNMNSGNNFNIIKFPFNQNQNMNNWNHGSNIQKFNGFNQFQFNNNFQNKNNNILAKDEIGIKCFHLTNNFRANNNLPPLIWDDSIWRISYTHSKNMGDNIVPFGHNGFNNRLSQFPFHYSTACENVFKCFGYHKNTIAFEAVNGWINSPGHRKNLLSNTTHCAIATYISKNGTYYLTQMFAKCY